MSCQLQRLKWVQSNQWRQTQSPRVFSSWGAPAHSAASPGVTSGGVNAVWKMNTVHTTSYSEKSWSCTDLLQLLSSEWAEEANLSFTFVCCFSVFWIKGIKRLVDPCSCLEPPEREMPSGHWRGLWPQGILWCAPRGGHHSSYFPHWNRDTNKNVHMKPFCNWFEGWTSI